ncbi:hypothetical protein C2G38_2165947 [Gigaspora rosea]|uniref:RING-type domain-containing protein n=1 Tax=Gigaspora rosea TaxID=44941 RepID=A0A397W261_9GLOM|nr:hypothetical protein C2G38_2165947 [Gigaspora rosea]
MQFSLLEHAINISYTISLEPLSKGELAKKYPKQSELLKYLGINILKSHPNSLANNITISELENCHKCNEETLLNPSKAFTMLVCGHILYHDCLEKSNRDKQKTCPICFIDNEGTASTEIHISDVVENESLIKELSLPSGPIDDNNRENKSKESKPKTLLQLYYNASWAEKCITRAYQEEIIYFAENSKKESKKLKEYQNSEGTDHVIRERDLGYYYGNGWLKRVNIRNSLSVRIILDASD